MRAAFARECSACFLTDLHSLIRDATDACIFLIIHHILDLSVQAALLEREIFCGLCCWFSRGIF